MEVVLKCNRNEYRNCENSNFQNGRNYCDNFRSGGGNFRGNRGNFGNDHIGEIGDSQFLTNIVEIEVKV